MVESAEVGLLECFRHMKRISVERLRNRIYMSEVERTRRWGDQIGDEKMEGKILVIEV